MICCYGLGAATFAAGRPATAAELYCLRSHIPESAFGIEDETGTDYILPQGTKVEIRSHVERPCWLYVLNGCPAFVGSRCGASRPPALERALGEIAVMLQLRLQKQKYHSFLVFLMYTQFSRGFVTTAFQDCPARPLGGRL